MRAPNVIPRADGTAEKAARLVFAVVTAFLVYDAAQFVRYFFSPSDLGVNDPLARFEDDAFYYFEVARNVVAKGYFSFDGITPTNGFHPLWMACIATIGTLFPVGSAGFHVAVAALGSALVTGGAIALFQLLVRTRLLGDVASPGRLLAAAAAAAFYQACGLEIGARGMEVALTFLLAPLAIWCVLDIGEKLASGAELTVRDGFSTSLVCSALILSRLDAAVLVAAWGFALAVLAARARAFSSQRALRRLAPFAAGVLAGGCPLFAYLALNLATMGALMPVSGQAKRLVAGPGFTISKLALDSFLDLDGGMLAVILKPAWTVLGFLVAPGILVLTKDHWQEPRWVLLAATSAGTFAYYALLVLTSDWTLWTWYFWAAVLNGALGLAAALGFALSRCPWTLRPAVAGLGAVMVSLAVMQSVRPVGGHASDMKNVTDAIALQAFASRNPGVYAMGDRAGAAGYLVDYPLIQLEGLMGDNRTLEAIRTQTPLAQFLAAAGVDYYVTAWATPDGGNCFHFSEPALAGPSAPRMKGHTCRPPVAKLPAGGGIWRRRDLDAE